MLRKGKNNQFFKFGKFYQYLKLSKIILNFLSLKVLININELILDKLNIININL